MAGGGLEAFHQQLVLDHAKEQHGHGLRDPFSAEVRSVNPTCGDEVVLRVRLDDGVVRDLSWEGQGCAISRAATSVLHDLVTGRPVAETREVVEAYRAMLRSRGQLEPDEGVLGDAVAFTGVGRHLSRVRCAMLGWTAFEEALAQAGAAGGTTRQTRPTGQLEEQA